MTVTHNGDLHVSGAVYMGDMALGKIKVEPNADEPTEIEINGFDIEGSGTVCPMVTASTTVPGLRVREVGFRHATTNAASIYIYRTNDYPSVIHWMMWRS